jgi:hypothetical protein
MSTYPDAVDFASGRRQNLSAMARLARRAQEAGGLRADFTMDDLILVIMANRGIRAASLELRVAASRRFAALAIQALAATPQAVPLPPIAA